MAGVPDALAFLSKPEIAIERLKTARANDGPCRRVVAGSRRFDPRWTAQRLGLPTKTAWQRAGCARRFFADNASVGWFWCDVGGDGHAAATTSGVATVCVPEFLRTWVLVVTRPPPFVFLLPQSPPLTVMRGHHWRCRFSSFMFGCIGAIASQAQRYRVSCGRELPRV